jgi:hypothetical protein
MYVFGGLVSHQKGGNLQTFFECHLKLSGQSDDQLLSGVSSGGGSSSVLYQWDKIKAEAPRARDSHTVIHVSITQRELTKNYIGR